MEDRSPEPRKGVYQVGFGQQGVQSARKTREAKTVQIRKAKRDGKVQQRRRVDQHAATEEIEIQASDEPAAVNVVLQRRIARIPEHFALLDAPDLPSQIEGASFFRKLLAVDLTPPIKEVIECGAGLRLVQLLAEGVPPPLQLEAVWAVTNLACGNHEHTAALISYGTVPALLTLVRESHDDIVEQALWALGNVSADGAEARDIVLNEGYMDALENLLYGFGRFPSLSVMRHAAWTICNFSKWQPPISQEVFQRCVHILSDLIHSPDEELLVDACTALSQFVTEGGEEAIRHIFEAGCCKRVFELSLHVSEVLRSHAVHLISLLVEYGSNLHLHVLLAPPFCLCTCLSVALEKRTKPLHPDCYATEDELVGATKREEAEAVRSRAVAATVRDACASIQKVSSGGPAWVSQLLDASVLPPLYQSLQNGNFEIQCLAAMCICNLLRYGDRSHRNAIVQQAAIPQLLESLRLENVDLQSYVLQTILGLFEEPFSEPPSEHRYHIAHLLHQASAEDVLVRLASHPNSNISDAAERVLRIIEQEGQSAFGI